MPIDWIALLAGTTVSNLLGPRLKEGYGAVRDKTRDALVDGPLEGPLRRVYRDACTTFLATLRAVHAIDAATEAQIQVLMEDDAFLEALRQLPFVPLREISTTASREQFVALGLPGADADDFDAAWRALHKKFLLVASANDELKSLLDLSLAEATDDKLAELVDLVQEIKDRLIIAPRDDAPDVASYREHLYERYVYADTRGLFMREKEGTGEGIRLQDVFVETPLERTIETFRAKKEKDGEDDDRGSPDEGRGDGRVETRKETSPIGGVLRRERLTLVLGAPGSGKSTLMRCLAMALCHPGEPILDIGPEESQDVPVLFELKVFASELRQDPHRRLDHFLIERLRADLPSIETLLRNGKALVLLDGLDEVFDERDRRWVSDQVWNLVTRYPRSRFVLTSRPHGYQAAPLPGPVTRWRLVEFDDDTIRRFFHGWFEALAREGAEAGARQSPRERAEALTNDVMGRPRIRTMAENPMLCTLIVLVHRSRSGHLPERRVVFYEAAVKTLVESWERYKHSPRGVAEGYDFPEPELMVHALAEVAWRTFHELGRREIPGEKLREWLRESLRDFPEWTGSRGRKAVTDFLQVVQERTGLLIDLGGDRFQFVHLSLHEYLLAFHVLDRFDEVTACRVVRHYLHAPQWEEALRLTVAGAGQARATGIVRAILEEPTSEWEDKLCRDLRFVCRCLGDKASLTSEARDDIHGRLLEAIDGGEALDLPALMTDAARVGPGRVVEAMGKRLSDDDWSMRVTAVDFFARAGAVDEATRAAVEKRLSDNEEDVRRAAVDFFAHVGAVDEATRVALEKRLSDNDGTVRRAAVGFFAHIGAEDRTTRAAIEKLLSDNDMSVRRAALEFFAHIGAEDRTTRAAIEKLLSNSDGSVRRAAVEFFARGGADDEATRVAFEKHLSGFGWSVRLAALEFFARVGVDDEKTRAAIKQCLSDNDGSVRVAALEFFARVGADDETTRAAFKKQLSNHMGRVRRAAVKFFARVDADDETTRAAFKKQLSNSNWRMRLAAVEFFARVGADDEATRAAIKQRLSDKKDGVRHGAVEFFARVGADDEATRAAIEQCLSEKSRDVRVAAVEFFAHVGVDDEATRAVFEKRLSDKRDDVRHGAVEFFTRVGLSVDVAEEVFRTFNGLPYGTSAVDLDRSFSEVFGKVAPLRPELMRLLLEEGPKTKYFHMGAALPAAVFGLDRQRREAEPLVVREGR